jgi:nicotinamide-nucleotide amidase
MTANIISIGNELLIGDTINTNAAWIGEYLSNLGFEVKRIYTISDNPDEIKDVISECLKGADLVICTGGLGPTNDDISKKAVAELFGVPLVLHDATLSFIRKIFTERNIPFSDSNHDQAMVPENCDVLFNKAGTAPGMWFETEDSCLAMLPGVPYEMKYLMRKGVSDKIREFFGDVDVVVSRYIKTAGIGESTLADQVLGDLSESIKNGVQLAFLPRPGLVTLRIDSRAGSRKEAEKALNELSDRIYEKAGDLIFGEGRDFSLEEALGLLLKERKWTIATAESCTGGLISSMLTDIPGSSDYVLGASVTYSNEAKIKELGVAEKDLERVGAVSKEVALQMAKGVAEKFGSDFGISTTGIAGPGGGTKDKPVGTVWLGFWSADWHFAIKAFFTKDRILNKQRSAIVSMESLRRSILGIEVMPYDLPKHLPD